MYINKSEISSFKRNTRCMLMSGDNITKTTMEGKLALIMNFQLLSLRYLLAF